MTARNPYDLRGLDLPSETDAFRYLRDVYYADEEKSYLAWINPDLCNDVRRFIARRCSVPLSSVMLVGSARLGFSAKNGLPFEMGSSDLDVAIVSPGAVDELYGTFGDTGGEAAFVPVRPDHYPDQPFCAAALAAARKASEIWSNAFSAVSIAIYPSVDMVAMRTAAALRGWRQLAGASLAGGAPAWRLVGSRLDEIAQSGFPIFCGDVEGGSPLVSGPYVLSYDTLRTVVGALGNRDHLLADLDVLLKGLRAIVRVETLMIGGSVLLPEVSSPRDLDCALFYSALDDGTEGFGVDQAMKWVRKYRQKGIDMRLLPVEGPKWLTVKLAGYMTALFASSRSGRAQGPVIVDFDE